MTDQKIEEETRRQISVFLPDAIACALESYHSFAAREASNEPKDFTAHHSACKVAISHIELLIKLARWADLPDPAAENHSQQILLATMMQEAQGEVDSYKQWEENRD